MPDNPVAVINLLTPDGKHIIVETGIVVKSPDGHSGISTDKIHDYIKKYPLGHIDTPEKLRLQGMVRFLIPITDKPRWGFVKGQCEQGEPIQSCGIRELKEETGLELNVGRIQKTISFKYNENSYEIYTIRLTQDEVTSLFNTIRTKNEEAEGEIFGVKFINNPPELKRYDGITAITKIIIDKIYPVYRPPHLRMRSGGTRKLSSRKILVKRTARRRPNKVR